MMSEAERHSDAQEIEQEIEGLRSELGGLVHELDRRRHEATDLRLQIRRHPRAVGVLLSLVTLTAVGRVIVLRRRRANQVRIRAANLIRALALLSLESSTRLRPAVEGRPSAFATLARLGAAIVLANLPPARVR